MGIEVYKEALLREYLFSFVYLLYGSLFIFSRDELHKWLANICGFLLIFYIFIGRHFAFKATDFIISIIYLLFLIIFFIKVAIPQIRQKGFSYRPIIILLFFIISYFFGIKATSFNLPWLTGYMLAVVSFAIGFIVIKKGRKHESS